MTEIKGTVAIVGLGTMGRNLAENLADKGETVVVYNRTTEVARRLAQKRSGQIVVAEALDDLKHLLEIPRRVILLVGGGAQDALLTQLYTTVLGENDILMDFGNSYYHSTEAHQENARKAGINLLSVGISGGAEGARYGASLMISGDSTAYTTCRPLFTKIAAQGTTIPCEAYLGKHAEGHFVKMVHNGIEYALMQAIGEIVALYSFLHHETNGEVLAKFFEKVVKESGLSGYLLEIVPPVLRKRIESDTTGDQDFLINQVIDAASQKGTGKWTVEAAMQMDIPAPSLYAAVTQRILSSYQAERVKNCATYRTDNETTLGPELVRGGYLMGRMLGHALLAASILAFDQGFRILKSTQTEPLSKTLSEPLDLVTIAQIWTGGCIIRSSLLGEFVDAFKAQTNPLQYQPLVELIEKSQYNLRESTISAIRAGVPVPVLSSSLAYLDTLTAFRCADTALIQLMRDYFGGHGVHLRNNPGGNLVNIDWGI